ncbi:MAG TPA: hypothetical protein VFA26_21420 [Gemmataceae bacterium]|nr:hypothetical protein [Gemmataceae bacterium]
MQPVLPSWFKQRQAKLEPAGENTYRVTAPNLVESFIGIRPGENGRWAAFLRQAADAPDLAATGPEFANPGDAWGAAFELHRRHIMVGEPPAGAAP